MTPELQKTEVQIFLAGLALAAAGGVARVCHPDHPPKLWAIFSGGFVGLFAGGVLMLLFWSQDWNLLLGGSCAGIAGYASHAFLAILAERLCKQAAQTEVPAGGSK